MTQNYLPVDAAAFPQSTATRTVMIEIAEKYAAAYAAQLRDLPKDARLQKKFLSIQKSMAEQCATFAAMAYAAPDWATQIAKRRTMLERENVLTGYEDALSALPSDDTRGAFIQYAHANWMLHNAFIDRHLAQLAAANAAKQPERAMEDKLVLGTIYLICREWRAWWLENGTLAFDPWTYEDMPWEEQQDGE